MMTGDHAATAGHVAQAVGLITDHAAAAVLEGKEIKGPESWTKEDRERLNLAAVFARVDPKQKLDLVVFYQQQGDVVAMTGDGVNDAPALKKADIGIAMGKRGTQVAREAADMVLKDDSFATIVVAVEQGRVIVGNIRKFVIYLMSCNVSEILVVSLASVVDAPLPLLPLQVLFLNLVTDVFPALALGAGEGDEAVLRQSPWNARASIVSRRQWLIVGGYGLLITAAVLGAFGLAFAWLNMPVETAVTVSFLTLGFAQLWHVFNLRDTGSTFLRNDITQNPFIWAAMVTCTGLFLAAVYLPPLASVLRVTDPGVMGWLLIGLMSLLPWAIGQLVKSMQTRKSDR